MEINTDVCYEVEVYDFTTNFKGYYVKHHFTSLKSAILKCNKYYKARVIMCDSRGDKIVYETSLFNKLFWWIKYLIKNKYGRIC